MQATLTIDNPAYFDRLAAIEERHWWSIGVWKLGAYWLTSALRARRNLRAVDIGCGTGMTAIRLARLPMIEEVVGLDSSEHAVERARQRHDFSIFLGSALDLPFDAGRFDVATFFDVIQHVPEPVRALREIHRVLAPGGLLLARANGRGWSGDAASYRLSGLVDQVRSAGFRVIRASYVNCLPAIAQEVRAILRRRAGGGHPSGRGLRIAMPHPAVNRVMLGISQAEAFLAGKAGVALPFGHSTMILAERIDRLEDDRTAVFWSGTPRGV